MNQRSFLLLVLLVVTASSGFIKVAIVGTNDIHGSALPTQLYRSDLNQNYTYGGLEYMASMINTLREEFKGNFLYLDAGDQFQGGIQSGPLVSSGQIINDYMNEVSVDSSAIGNHQFDFGPNFLLPYINSRKDGSWNLAANLRSETGEQEFLPKHKNMFIFTLQSGIKIGVIGLSTVETPTTTGAFKDGAFPPYEFKHYAEIVLEGSRKLREGGANAVILVSHMGNDCNADYTRGYWEESTFQQSTCSPTDEMSLLLNAIPQGTIDGVVQGHRHKFSHHFINGVPVMGTINGGYYFNIMYLFFYDKKIYNKAIDGPWPVCEKVFSNLGRCNYLTKKQLQIAGNLIDWQFHGVKVVKNPKVSRLFETKWLPKMNRFLQPLAMNELTLQRLFNQQSLIGNLITDLLFKACPGHDFVLLNEGGFRTIWYPGIIQFQHFYNMFPFNNDLISFEMTGHELIKTLQILQAGKKSFYPTKNLKQRVRVYPNGTRELISVTFYDGAPIQESKTYRGVSLDFLLSGGDDFQNVMGKIYSLRKQTYMGEFKDLLKPQLISYGTITESKLRDPFNPRLIIDYL